MKVSIIIPVYNIIEYLPDCIDSVLAQSFTDFELILVDDGSTDGSAELCDTLKERDSRIKVIHQTNGGVSSARNRGIDIARGEWIAFIDGDDYIVPDYIEKMLATTGAGSEIVCCNLAFINIDKTITKYPFTNQNTYISEDIINGFFTDEVVKTQFYSPVNKLIKRKSLRDIRFRNFALGEDLLFIFELLQTVRKITVIPLVGYHYIKRAGSATTSGFSSKKLDYVKVAHIIEEMSMNISEETANKANLWALRHSIVTLRQVYKHRKEQEYREYVLNERAYLSSNISKVGQLGVNRIVDALLLSCLPQVYRILPV